MRIDNIKTSIGNNLEPKKGICKKQGNLSFPKTSDVFFRSENVNQVKTVANNLQQKARLLFMNPKYATSFETFRKIFDNISRYLSENVRKEVFEKRKFGLEWGIHGETPVIIENEHQLKFIENVLAHDIKPDHPIIKNAIFNYNAYFSDALSRIKTKENAEAKSYAYNFLMKHPENIFDSHSVNGLLLFSEKDRNKNYIEFIDKNFDTITQKLNISNRKLMEHLYHVNSEMSWDFNAHKGNWFENVWNVMMGNEDITEFAKRFRLNKDQVRKRDEYYFKDWYLNDVTKHNQNARQTVEKLRRVFDNDKIQFSLNARNLSEILEFDENITIPELLYIDNVVNSFTPHNKIRDAYEMASPFVKQYVRRKVNYNENNRKFLWYVADDKNRSSYERQQRFLDKTVLESIKTPEQLATAMKLYNEFSDKGALPSIDKFSLTVFLNYNLSFEDIIRINKEASENYLKLYVYRNLLENGKFHEKPIEKQLELWSEE